jgi:hypothetical protein
MDLLDFPFLDVFLFFLFVKFLLAKGLPLSYQMVWQVPFLQWEGKQREWLLM